MVIVTETGSQYIIIDGLCVKKNKEGVSVDSFKIWSMKPVPHDVKQVNQIFALPEGKPTVGQRFYVAGKDSWWVTTRVVSVDGD